MVRPLRQFLILAVAAWLAAVSSHAWSQAVVISEVDKLLPSDPRASDFFGYSVSASGDTVVVGAFRSDRDAGSGTDQGAAYVFERTETGWTETARLLASDGRAGDLFGTSVSISGAKMVIGAHLADVSRGAAYVFERTAAGWVEAAKLVASDRKPGDSFGFSTSISGDTIVVGAFEGSSSGSGGNLKQSVAYVFERGQDGWAETAELFAGTPNANSIFGVSTSVSISGDTLAVAGGTRATEAPEFSDRGVVHVFERTGDSWLEAAVLQAGDGTSGDEFGISVSVFGDTLAVGALREDGTSTDSGQDQGAVYVFERTGTTWLETAKLLASDGERGDQMGIALSTSESVVLAGALRDDGGATRKTDQGSVYAFQLTDSGWIETAKLLASDGGAQDFTSDRSGVALIGSTVVVGAMQHDATAFNAGAAYVFSLDLDDADADGIADSVDNCLDVPNGDQVDSDSDMLGDSCDLDDDNDGIDDGLDEFPLDSGESIDTDGDGTGDNADADDDDDGQSDVDEADCGSDPLDGASVSPDRDGDGVPDCADDDFARDRDDDGVDDDADAFPDDPGESIDTDGDGTGDNADADDDGDGQSDVDETTCGSDPLDGASVSPDRDGDGSPDCTDVNSLPGRSPSLAPDSGSLPVNTTIVGVQTDASVTALSDGGYVVAWTSPGQDGSGSAVVGRRFDAQGAPIGDEFVINTATTAGNQDRAEVTGLSDGGFFVSWSSFEAGAGGWQIKGRRFDADDVAQGDELTLNTTEGYAQLDSSTAMLGDGSLVVTWRSNLQDGSGEAVVGRRFDAGGTALGDEFVVNGTIRGGQTDPAVAATVDGGFTVVWTSADGQDGSGDGVYLQRFDGSANAAGAETRANTTTRNDQRRAAVAALKGGGVLVVWSSFDTDGSREGIYAQSYDGAGDAMGAELQVNSATSGAQQYPVVAALADGTALVSWTSGDGSGNGVFAQRLSATGEPLGEEFRVNAGTRGNQTGNAAGGGEQLAGLASGRAVLVWQDGGDVAARLIGP